MAQQEPCGILKFLIIDNNGGEKSGFLRDKYFFQIYYTGLKNGFTTYFIINSNLEVFMYFSECRRDLFYCNLV